MIRQAGPRREERPEELAREFVDHWLGLSGEAWIALGGIDDVRHAFVEAATAMAPQTSPGARPRAVIWSTDDLAALDLPGLLTAHGYEFSMATDHGDAGVGASGLDETRVERRIHAAAADLGITSCAWAAADTGTIALYATPSTGRLPSLLPTAHVALVRSSRLVRTITDGLALLAEYAASQGGFPSAVNLISGPSRTGDIEGDLAVGVHGPMRAGVIIGDW